jgi:hypothetical protein
MALRLAESIGRRVRSTELSDQWLLVRFDPAFTPTDADFSDGLGEAA